MSSSVPFILYNVMSCLQASMVPFKLKIVPSGIVFRLHFQGVSSFVSTASCSPHSLFWFRYVNISLIYYKPNVWIHNTSRVSNTVGVEFGTVWKKFRLERRYERVKFVVKVLNRFIEYLKKT